MITKDKTIHPVTGDDHQRPALFIDALGRMTLFEFELPAVFIGNVMSFVTGLGHAYILLGDTRLIQVICDDLRITLPCPEPGT